MPVHRSIQIGSVTISPPLALAPMAGLTDSAFRRLIRNRGGCGLVVTEMVNAAAFSPKALRSHRMLHVHESEHPIAVQISGHDPQAIARAAAIAQKRGLDLVDINAGCPVRQVTGSGSGAALLRDLGRLETVLRAVHQAVDIPLTLKFRSGWDAASIVAREVATLAEGCGCAAITLHPRTRAQGYSGQADWALIAEVVAAVRIPVFASGDIRSSADARRCLAETGCAGLMIARQSLANPWILAQVAADMAGQAVPAPTPADHYHLLLEYLDLLAQSIPTELGRMGKIKQLVGKLRLGLPGVAAFRQEIMHSHSVERVRGIIDTYFGEVANVSSGWQGGPP